MGAAYSAAATNCDRVCCGNWCTNWSATDEQREYWPPRHSDFRDSAPEQLLKVYELYRPVVQEGRWTEGLCEMWWRKNKPVKHSVHIPCWDSFKWNPLKWRGPCFGRTFEECYWTGNRQMRWSRAIYAANLGREYVMPVRNIGRHGYKSDIKALCCMYFLMSCIFSCGIGQAVTCCGSSMIMNCAAWYSCHARERMRRRYNLPPAFCLPPGIDDCLVHFFCFYCAAHQEARELALRGIDGPGMHILDVLPKSFPNAKCIEEAKAGRKAVLEQMLKKPPKAFCKRDCKVTQAKVRHEEKKMHGFMALLRHKAADAAAVYAEEEEPDGDMPVALDRSSPMSTASTESSEGLGWVRYSPPDTQEMGRGSSIDGWAAAEKQLQLEEESLQRHSMRTIPVIQEGPPEVQLTRWSVAY